MNEIIEAMSRVIEAQNNLICIMRGVSSCDKETLYSPVTKKGDIPLFKDYSYSFLERHKSQVRRTTYDTYTWNLQKKIIPDLGNMCIDEITSDTVQNYVNHKIEGGMSVHSARDNVGIIKLILKDYFKREGGDPPIIDIKYPRDRKWDVSERVLKEKDFQKLYDYGLKKPSKIGIAVLLGLTLGMRIGEVCGLKMKDIDFDQKQIYVRRSVKRVKTSKGSELEISDPKTNSSIRTLPLTSELAIVMKQIEISPEEYVVSEKEKPTEPRTLRQSYDRLLKRLGIEHHTFHDLRHTFASRLISEGVDARTVADLMGHTTVEMTLNTYTHANEKQKRKAVEKNLCIESPIMNG